MPPLLSGGTIWWFLRALSTRATTPAFGLSTNTVERARLALETARPRMTSIGRKPLKKILNDPFGYAEETLHGLTRAYPQYYRLVPGTTRVIARADGPIKGKVGIVSGGGSGHLPIFTGYVGPGFLDAVACGDVFASPSADEMATAMRAADGGAGVLRLYGNYGGDVMNFDMAGDLAEMDGITSTTVLLADDVASAPLAEREKRRGVAGMVLTFKIAGAAAEAGLDLDGVTAVAQRAADGCRTMGVALSPCTVPQAGKPTFTIADDEMEIGMGIHGEPGVKRGKLQPANEIADAMLDPILADLGAAARRARHRAGQQPRRHAGGGTVHSLQPHRRPNCRRGTDDRPSAGWPLCDLDGNGRCVADGAAARRRTRELSDRAGRMRVLEGVTWTSRSSSLRHAIASILAVLEAEHERLTSLDGQVGDGDLGITLIKAFRELDRIKGDLPDDLGQALMQGAAAVAKVSSSSFGTLLATSMMAVAKQTKGTRPPRRGARCPAFWKRRWRR